MSSSGSVNRQPFDFSELYAFASWLYAKKPNPCSESLKRTIIGRSYYAALICARDFTGASTSGPEGHKAVVRALKSINSLAGNNLDTLRLMRHKADYEPTVVISDRDVGMSLRNSLVVLKAVGKVANDEIPYAGNFLEPGKFVE